MPMKNEKYLHSELTSKILEAFYQVYNKVGFGFEKNVYVKSLAIAMKNLELKREANKELPIYFSGEEVGKIKIDIFVDNKVLVKVTNEEELKKPGRRNFTERTSDERNRSRSAFEFRKNARTKKKSKLEIIGNFFPVIGDGSRSK